MPYILVQVESVLFEKVWGAFKKLSLSKRIEVINNYAYKHELAYCNVIRQTQVDNNYFCLDSYFFRCGYSRCWHKSELTRIFKKKIKKDLCHKAFYKMIIKALAE